MKLTTELNIEQLELDFTAKVEAFLREIRFAPSRQNVSRAKSIILRAHERKFGRSNLTVWRITNTSTTDLIKLVNSANTSRMLTPAINTYNSVTLGIMNA